MPHLLPLVEAQKANVPELALHMAVGQWQPGRAAPLRPLVVRTGNTQAVPSPSLKAQGRQNHNGALHCQDEARP